MSLERYIVSGELEPVSHYCYLFKSNGFVWLSGMVGMKADGTIPEGTEEQFEIA